MNSVGVEESQDFRGTTLWKESVALFRNGVPLGKHRYWLQTAENCFVAKDSITWFQNQIEQEFNINISRTQTHQLMQKFFKERIIVKVQFKKADQGELVDIESSGEFGQLLATIIEIKESDFQDDGQLYKLGKWDKEGKVTLKNNEAKDLDFGYSSKHEQCSTLIKSVEIYSPWKNTFYERLVQIHGSDILGNLKPSFLNGDMIRNNLTQIDESGCVLNSKAEEEFPEWLVDMMVCLESWPNHPEFWIKHLPYGHELGIFKKFQEYLAFYSNNPFVPMELYEVFIKSFTPDDKDSKAFEQEPILPSSMPEPDPETISNKFRNLKLRRALSNSCLPVFGSRMSTPNMRGMFACVAAQHSGEEAHELRKSGEECVTGFGDSTTALGLTTDTEEEKELKVSSLRFLTLLLPPQNRRNLQILIRSLKKIIQNDTLKLDKTKTNREIVVHGFFKPILSPANGSESAEPTALKIVEFMLDHEEAIFKLGDETEFITKLLEEIEKEEENHKTADLDAPIGNVESVTPHGTEQFSCKRITVDEYEKEKFLLTSKALRELLAVIDKLEDPKVRKHKLQEFRREYPHIYAETFGLGDFGVSVTEQEQTGPGGTFNFFKSLL